MTPLMNSMLAGVVAGVLSMLCAALVIYTARPAWVPLLVSYAIGALLGAVFLEILPHAFHHEASPEAVSATVLVGILIFFLLEKLVLWRHVHVHDVAGLEAHAHAHAHEPQGRTGAMVVVGDSVHNFVDGIIIAAAFVSDTRLGMVTALAIIAHELPQEAGDALVLLHSGMSRPRALAFNLFSSMATLVGAVIACLALQSLQKWVPYLLALASASMIYVAVADLIPGLHRRVDLRTSALQMGLIVLGVASIHWAHVLILE
ncbi:ZIP family metal transporter [Ferrovum myxofaciens]|jgi:zinc and cadmium transporter|uniref:Zinc transporter ZupT n=3 Tax=root TaxID=1 RepID=A0A149VZ26_9PROT|nr:ZIP family metal transporter [Ferrovum myxofaciens]KXW58467.1 zinc transporter ZupT [Ferrovum myxofaciens]MBU6994518.1 ZIP family metal transporter [Ferrovum myxofaciens]QKE40916.1 MAG: ZIP family metal transporter [Ferrovum myxofaciens]